MRRLFRLGSGLVSFIRRVVRGFVILGAAALGVVVLLVKGLEKQQLAEAKLTAVLRATGNAAGFTKDQLIAQARALQKITTFGDEAIITLQALFATFKEIKGDQFVAATKAALDMSTVLGQDLKGSAIQLGKALNDPIKGVTALRKVGVSFNAEQLKLIAGFVAAGDMAAAMNVILKELRSEFGGAAAEAATTLGGRIKQLKNEFGDMIQKIATDLEPGLRDLIESLRSLVEIFAESPDKVGKFVNALSDIIWSAIRVVDWFGKIRQAWIELKQELSERSLRRAGRDLVDARKELAKAEDPVGRLTAQRQIVRAMEQQARAARALKDQAKEALKAERDRAEVRAIGRGDTLGLGILEFTEAAKADRIRVAGAKANLENRKVLAAATQRLLNREREGLKKLEQDNSADAKKKAEARAKTIAAAKFQEQVLDKIAEGRRTEIEKEIRAIEAQAQEMIAIARETGKSTVEIERFKNEQIAKIRDKATADSRKRLTVETERLKAISDRIKEIREKELAPEFVGLQALWKKFAGRPEDDTGKQLAKLAKQRTDIQKRILEVTLKEAATLKEIADATKKAQPATLVAAP